MRTSLHISLALCLLAQVCGPVQAQITFGGQPLWTSTLPASEQLPPLDRDQLEREDAVTDLHKEAPWRFGVEHEVSWSSETHGSWTSENGQLVWRLLIDGADATCMSLRFQHFEVPKGGQLFLYAADHSEVLGALDHRSEKEWGGLATGVVQTNALVVEYRQPMDLGAYPLLDIDQVVQGYRSLSGWPHGPNDHDRGPFGNSGACNINVNCPEGAAWATESRSVALIVNGGFASCTGGLVNNTANDGTPYFLTANHCLGNPGNWVYYFNHESATCNGNNGPTNQSISGGTLLVNSGGSDVALIELSQTPPPSFNVQYAGWDASGVTPTSTVGIHHPSGDLKKICFDDDSPSAQNQFGAAVWYVADWDLGVTEPGSSGSPLFDQNHRVIGQLYGGTAACQNPQSSVDNDEPDWYGRFDVSWDAGLSDYLDAGGTGTLVWDGYPDGAITYDNDAGVNITGYPQDVLCNVSQVSIDITLTNTGNNTLTSCMILFSVNGGDEQQQSWAGNLAPGASELVSLGSIWSQGGTNTIEAQVTDPNGTEDENVANNSSSVNFNAYAGPTTTVNFSLVLDAYPDETTWELKQLGQTLYTGGPYSEDQAGETIMESFCLPAGCYIFRIEDEYEDGICCDFGEGSWSLIDIAGDLIWNGSDLGTGGEFEAAEQFQFCTNDISDVPIEPAFNMSVYPVPAHNEVVMVWPSAEGQATIRDAVGRLWDTRAVTSGQDSWNVQSWPAGTYLVQWEGGRGERQVRRMVVTH